MAVAPQPRWSFLAPGEAAIGAFLSRLRADRNASHFSYPEVGASRHDAERPRGYTLDHIRIQLGEGVAAFGGGRVWYDRRAFSRPRYWPVRIGKRIARRLQARFVRESQAAMRAAVVCSRPVSVEACRSSTPA
jgi:uncharacterized protein (UPF0548 family)